MLLTKLCCTALPEFPATTTLPSDWRTSAEMEAVLAPKAVVTLPPEPNEVSSCPVQSRVLEKRGNHRASVFETRF